MYSPCRTALVVKEKGKKTPARVSTYDTGATVRVGLGSVRRPTDRPKLYSHTHRNSEKRKEEKNRSTAQHSISRATTTTITNDDDDNQRPSSQ